ncbi:hypothetical protein [Stieleria varia]|uniref:Uncharacterized protein n=1 Tax=Stieleria varia TaxID=2528005 RepID=A0A5C6B7X8_9BACT|nr:hypothetical protein [Stieleria varia]TWU08365.1 hypothetical protein Pla52n_09470 [Stieleria varia]
MNLDNLAESYRVLRKLVVDEATRPTIDDAERHRQNQGLLKSSVASICDAADLGRYGYCKPNSDTTKYADRVWRQLWTRIRFAGIRSQIATNEIREIGSYFDNYQNFISPDWDLETRGYTLVSGGRIVHDFLNRESVFAGKQTIGNLPKLKRTVNLARKFEGAIRSGQAPIDFILGGYRPEQVWEIHHRLIKDIGYGGLLTALHFMMDIGLPVIKPDIVVTKLMVHWGWLQSRFADVPDDLSEADIRGEGRYGGRYRYDKPFMYRRVIDLAREIVARVSPETLKADIGWVTSNPLREFDLFIVKFGQQPEKEFGIERTLFDASGERPQCQNRPPDVNLD